MITNLKDPMLRVPHKKATLGSTTTMAETMDRQRAPPLGAFGVMKSIVNGRHPLSKFIPMALLAIDAVLCVLIIMKVPCVYCPIPRSYPS